MVGTKPVRSVNANETSVLPFPCAREDVPRATEFRSTWLASSLEDLRLQGHFERYLTLLESHREEILTSVAATWIPLAVARSHYRACDALRLSAEQIETMARGGGSVRKAWYANTIAAAQRPDTTIWTVLPQLQKLWLRSANGGAVAVHQLDSNSAHVHYVGCELFSNGYFREAFRAVLLLLMRHVEPHAALATLPGGKADEVEFRLSWRAR